MGGRADEAAFSFPTLLVPITFFLPLLLSYSLSPLDLCWMRLLVELKATLYYYPPLFLTTFLQPHMYVYHPRRENGSMVDASTLSERIDGPLGAFF